MENTIDIEAMQVKLLNEAAELYMKQSPSLNESFIDGAKTVLSVSGDLIKKLAVFMWKEHKFASILIVGLISAKTYIDVTNAVRRISDKLRKNKLDKRLNFRMIFKDEIDKIKFCKFIPETCDVCYKYDTALAKYASDVDKNYKAIIDYLGTKNIDVEDESQRKKYLSDLQNLSDKYIKSVESKNKFIDANIKKFEDEFKEAEKHEWSEDLEQGKKLIARWIDSSVELGEDYEYNICTDYDDFWEGIEAVRVAYDSDKASDIRSEEGKRYNNIVNSFYKSIYDIVTETNKCDSAASKSFEIYPKFKVQFKGNKPKE